MWCVRPDLTTSLHASAFSSKATARWSSAGMRSSMRAWVTAMCTEVGKTRSEEHTSELQSLMRISYAVFCLKKKKQIIKIKYSKNTIQKCRQKCKKTGKNDKVEIIS